MASKAKEIVVHIRKGLVFAVRVVYRSVRNHPFVWSTFFFLMLLYRYLPCMFSFVVYSSPIVVCTALLLGTLLIFGDANIPLETDEARNAGHGDNGVVVCEDKNVKEVGSIRADVVGSRALSDEEGDEELETAACSLVNEEISKPAASISGHLPWQSVEHAGDASTAACSLVNEEISKPATSISGHLPWKSVEHGGDASSGSDESDIEEESSPDASVSDIIPMLDELHPLLDSEAPLPSALRSVDDDSDATSSITSHDQVSDDGSVEEEIENQEDEEDEGQEEKDYATEVVLKWTADDQKNLMDLGTSELERNQRLENLIAKRRARKFLSFHGEKNLIDLDGIDPVPPNTEDLSRFNFQIPSISAPRRNPFDVPFEEDIRGLPPIPGSAPSVMQPRGNPFDVPYNLFVPSPSPQREMFIRRQETFSMGASSSGDMKQEPQVSVFKPYFVPESDFIPFKRESTEKDGDSKVSSSHESDTTSSEMDPEDHRELVEPEVHPENHYVEPANEDSQSSSDEVDSMHASHEQIGVDETGLTVSSSVTGEIHETADAFGAVEMEIRRGDYSSADSDAEKLEVIEERYDDSSSSSSSESYENDSKMSINESEIPEQARDNSSIYFDDSVQSVSADFDLSIVIERVDDGQVADPVYDSSPSAIEKSLSNASTLEDALLFAGKEGFTSDNSLTSDLQTASIEEGLAHSSTHENNVSSENRPLESDRGDIWVAPPSLSFVDENESRSREISEITERDVIHVGLPTVEEFSHPISPKLPKFVLPSRLSFRGNAVEDVIINNGSSSNSPLLVKPLRPSDVSKLHSERSGLERLLSIENLPPILEEHPDENEGVID